MRRTVSSVPVALVAGTLSLAAASVAAADWQPVAAAAGEQAEIDKSRIMRVAPGKTIAWTRLVLGRRFVDSGIGYSAVQAMNRYDCEARRFATLKRVYMNGPDHGQAMRTENVGSPREMAVEPGSVDEQLLTEACKARTVGEAKQLAAEAARRAAEAREDKAAVKHADIRGGGGAADVQVMPIAEQGAIEVRPPVERPRFIDLPKIDKSQLEEPKPQPKAAEPKPAAPVKPPAAKTAESKPATPVPPTRTIERTPMPQIASRHELERQLATSGPRRAMPIRRSPADDFGAPERRDVPWAYEGEGAPANWAKLRPDYGLCATGRRQSPIDIREGIRVDLEPILFDYKPSLFRITDTGQTIQVGVGEGNSMSIMGRSYQLQHLHFHRPAEERVYGKTYDMDVHFVHKDAEGRIAKVAVLIEKGAEHPLIQTLWNNLPLEVNQDVTPANPIDVSALLPDQRAYYTYMGSQTTPPCSENVLWMVLKQPVQVSAEQVAIFSRLYKNNARPVQPTNNRLIKENR